MVRSSEVLLGPTDTRSDRSDLGVSVIIGALAGAGITVAVMQTLVVAIIPQLPRL